MWDGRVNHLEVQPLAPMANPIEMASEVSDVLSKLRRSTYYRNAFKEAFGDTLISSERMLKAMTQFTGLMISANSRYDKFMRHEDTLTQFEFNGLIYSEKSAPNATGSRYSQTSHIRAAACTQTLRSMIPGVS